MNEKKQKRVYTKAPACLLLLSDDYNLDSSHTVTTEMKCVACFVDGARALGCLVCSCVVLVRDWQTALGFAAKSQEHWRQIPFSVF